jgi:hypothetical protein
LNIKETNCETLEHIQNVRNFLSRFAIGLLNRAADHDQSKLHSPEVEYFAEYTDQLRGMTYGSPEYDAAKLAMKPALDHHYAVNRHHPEHFKEGIDDMNLLDLVEMFCDWKAAGMRHNDGNLRYSIEKNAVRFHMSGQLKRIFENSIELVE